MRNRRPIPKRVGAKILNTLRSRIEDLAELADEIEEANTEREIKKTPISEEEKARRRNIVERTNHSLRLEGQERDSLSAHAEELWINGKITLKEKTEVVMSAVRAMAKPTE